MIKPIFNRYERKYVLTTKQKDDLIIFLKDFLIDDFYSNSGSKYSVHNIYFDTQDFAIIRNSIQRPKYKDKLRLRSYKTIPSDDDLVFLEIKKKFQGVVNKRRVIISYKDAINYLENNVMPVFTSYFDQQVMQEIDYFIKIHKAKPGAYIAYDRVALMSPNEQLRVTFDHNIIFRNKDITLQKTHGEPVLNDSDIWLMEVKSENNFPFWLARKLSEYELYSQSFSKYGKAYQKFLLGGNHVDYIL